MYAYKHQVEHNFEVGDLVFLKLLPYRQYSLKKSGVEKINPHLYGPYKVSRRFKGVAYELECLENINIHNVFHVSSLEKESGQQVTSLANVPPLDEE